MAEKLIHRHLPAALNLPEQDKILADLAKTIDWRSPVDEDKRYMFASEIVRQASDLVDLVDPTSLLLESKTLEPGVTAIKFNDLVGFEARTVTSGGYKERIRIDNEITTYPIPRRYEHVTIEILKDDLELGTYGDIAKIREGIAEALLRKKINAVWLACNDAITSLDESGSGTGNENRIYLAGSALTEDAVDAAIDKMDSDGGGAFSIIGHPTKVNPIVKFSNFITMMPEQVKVDYWRTGFLGIYRGTNIIRMPNVVDKKYGLAPTDSRSVFVLGAGLGEIDTIRGMRAETWDDKERDVQIISAQHQYVVITWQPKGAFKIKLH